MAEPKGGTLLKGGWDPITGYGMKEGIKFINMYNHYNGTFFILSNNCESHVEVVSLKLPSPVKKKSKLEPLMYLNN